MIRLISLLLFILLLSLSISLIAEEPGKVAVDWGVYHIESSVLTLIAATAFFALACMALYGLFMFLLRSPKRFGQARLAKRQALGITALTETFAAIASQDIRGARRYLKRAEGLLPDQPLTLMLASQVARLEGNDSKSQLYLERMSKTGLTEFLALRGLIENARRAGENDVALRHAEKAYEMKPHDHWLATTIIGLYGAMGRTGDALNVLERAARKRALHADEVHQIRAAVLCAHARALGEQQQWESAIVALKDALRRHSKFVPAIVQMADIYIARGDISMAMKVAGDGWRRVPHPEIEEVLLRAFEATKDKAKAAKLLRKLAKLHADSNQAQVLMAGVAAKQGDYASARGILKQVIHVSGETSRLCGLLANVEHADGNHDQEAYWFRRAKESPAGSVWECNACKRPANIWELSCPQCGTVGSIL